jgi:hypothetical protein
MLKSKKIINYGKSLKLKKGKTENFGHGLSRIDLPDYVVRAGTKREKQIDNSPQGRKECKGKILQFTNYDL